ncbi:MAG: methyltransferase family protein [Phycisphaerales bacterium]
MWLEKMVRQGNWLFRRRGVLPLALIPVALLAAATSVYNERIDDAMDACGVAISLLGLALRMWTVGSTPRGTSGRNTAAQKAERLNTTGIYSIVRHPLYLANLLIIAGIVSISDEWWLVLIVVLAFFLYYERIIAAEEQFLKEKFGDAYTQWARSIPAIIPRLRAWRPSDTPFSWKKAIRQEYTALLVIAAGIPLTDMLFDTIAGHITLQTWARDDTHWIIFGAAGALLYATLRTIRHHTSLLNVPR